MYCICEIDLIQRSLCYCRQDLTHMSSNNRRSMGAEHTCLDFVMVFVASSSISFDDSLNLSLCNPCITDTH